MTTQRSPREAEEFLAANPDVTNIQVILTDADGVGRGKSVRRNELARIYTHGRYLPGSILGLDITGADVEETGLVWEDGDADRACWPIPGTLVRSPWQAPAAGQLLVSMYELDGTPSPGDPRHALQRVVDRFAALNLTPVIAIELEFYLLDRTRGESGRPRPPASPVSGFRPSQLQAYLLTDLDDQAPFLGEVYAACETQGIPAQTLISEYAPGQLEIVLHHRADAMRAVDEAIMYKRLVRGVAAKHGMDATFMAKPYAGSAGSGMHMHMSLQDAAGRNAFASDDPKGNELLRQAIGGMAATMAECVGIFAPNANSYRRFRRNSYAPLAPTWGVNNRSVSLRVPAGAPETRHVEHRVAGADANPYLAAAAMLAGAHRGIVEKRDPGPAIEGNGYEQVPASLPSNWYDALGRTEDSSFLKDYLGARFLEIYGAIKRAEQDRFYSQVTELDFEWYLRTA
ncbi:MAG TPA: glutamine synthetase family protein [Candidatus Acidoferrum sp.]|nr:glutamine synthetase family protein [Candidatus Acidoferrum sp.]